MTAHDASFAIAHTLLDATMAAPAWTNLGCWQRLDGTALTRYAEAAEQLALLVGEAAISAPGQCIVDLGCGHGASLLLWQPQFAAARVIGIELQSACVQNWPHNDDTGITLHQGRFDQLPLPKAVTALLPASGCDAVVCVDAAYHADSLDAFTAVARQLLRPQGRLAFTTVLRSERTRLGPRFKQRILTHLSGIPPASVANADELMQALTRQGFDSIHLEYLDHEVLQGFADFVARQKVALSRTTRYSPAWLKIAATGAMCRHWYRTQDMRYVLISATRTD